MAAKPTVVVSCTHGAEAAESVTVAYLTAGAALDAGHEAVMWLTVDGGPLAVDVAILTGAGDAFCSGADLKTYIPPIIDEASPARIREIVDLGLGGFTRGMHRIPKPIVGAINGWALAGGLETALACDVRIAS